MIDQHALNIYTDGSSFSSPRVGGVGIRFVFPDHLNREPIDFILPGYKGATNNEMELKACILALKEAIKLDVLKMFSRVLINTDSYYIVDNYNIAIYHWSRTKWSKKGGAPVLNADLWKELLNQIKKVRKRVDFNWVKGHSKDEHNKAADRLAKKSAKNPINKPLKVIGVRKKLTDKSVEVGCVKARGQKLSIRIITSELLPQKIYKYKYEVRSKKSIYFKLVDIIYSFIVLKDGHCYFVKLNNDINYPQISKVFREII